MHQALLSLAFVAFSSLSFASTDQTASTFVLCKNQKNVRTIRILPEQKDNCTVTYSKGVSEEILGSKRPMESCRSILKNVQADLEEAKWRCRSVRSAQVTTGAEVSVQ